VSVNGDQVRDVRFRTASGNGVYDASQVDDLLRRIAGELDAGRPAGPLIANAAFEPAGKPLVAWGYGSDDVDWFLEQLRDREDPSRWARMSADPWRDLPVVEYVTRRGPGGLADRIAAPSRRARRKYKTQNEKYLRRECADAWRDFGEHPGAHLRWVRAGLRRHDLRTAEQQTIASLRYGRPAATNSGRPATISAGGRTFTWKRATRSSWPDIAAIVGGSHGDYYRGHFLVASTPQAKAIRKDGSADRVGLQLMELLDETGTPVLYTSGDGSFIMFPDQRWLRCQARGFGVGPPRGTKVIVTAVDQAGNKVARVPDRRQCLGAHLAAHGGDHRPSRPAADR
jgi:DivIVA domain-containing protein